MPPYPALILQRFSYFIGRFGFVEFRIWLGSVWAINLLRIRGSEALWQSHVLFTLRLFTAAVPYTSFWFLFFFRLSLWATEFIASRSLQVCYIYSFLSGRAVSNTAYDTAPA